MVALLDMLAIAVAALVLVPVGYLGFLTLLSGRIKAPTPPAQATVSFDFVVPAHNEELGIARTVKNLLEVDWPAAKRRVIVVADNCKDATAKRAAEAGATVLERFSDDKKGKGYALHHAFEHSIAEGRASACVVVDADTLVSKNLLSAFAARLELGEAVAQAHYGVLEEKSSWRTRLMRIAFSVFHGVRSLARERLGLSCGLRGNGMCFSHRVLKEVPHDAFSVVEDVEYGIRIGKKGYRVAYVHEAEVLGEMVSSEEASRSQRRRWEGGRMLLMKEHGWPLFKQGLSQGKPLLLDLAADVLVPPLSYLVAASFGGLGATGLVAWLFGLPWGSPWLFGVSSVVLTAYVLRGWALSGVGPRGLLDLAYAPVYVAWKLKLMLAPKPEKKGEWVRTQREAELKNPPPGT